MELMRVNGYESFHAPSGWDAMKLALDHPPDLIIMDIQLPDISGVKATRMLKTSTQFQGVPIIAVTAFMKEWTEDKCMEAGADIYLTKPISVPEFLEAVKRFLN